MIRDFSNDWFGPALEKINNDIFEKVRKYPEYESYMDAYNKGLLDKELREMEHITMKRFGLKIKVVEGHPVDATGGGVTYFVQRMSHNIYSSLQAHGDNQNPDKVYENVINNDVKEFFKKNAGKKGYVDEVNLKVSGVFSEYETLMAYNFWDAIHYIKVTPYILTGFMLHETRHVFQSFAWSHKVDRISVLMQELSSSIKNSEPAKKREYILVNLEDMSLLNKEQVEELAKEERALVLGGKLFTYIYKNFFHQNNYFMQASHNAEDDADSFAVMFGYGDAIMQLFKLYDEVADAKSTYKDTGFNALSLTVSLYILLTVAMSPLIFCIAGFLAVISGIKLLKIIFSSFKWGATWSLYLYNYDDNKNRRERFNRDLTSRLKNFNIDKNIKKTILDQIEINERLLNKAKDEDASIFTQWLGYKIIGVFQFFDFLGHKGQLDKLEESREMERLAFNKLFIASAKLDVSKEAYKQNMKNISLELISPQYNDSLGPSIDKIHEDIRKIVMTVNSQQEMDKLVTKSVFSEYVTKIEELIYNRIGLSISLHQEVDMGCCCMPYQIRLNTITNIRDKSWYDISADSDFRDFAITNYMSQGEIDNKHAKISGVMSKYNHYLNMEYWQLFKFARLTPREATAVLLHEVGHLYTFVELGMKTDRTNQILNEISNSFKNKEPASKRRYLLVDLEEMGMIEKDTVEKLAKEERHIIMSAKLYGAIYKKYFNSSISLEYTDITGETVADDFSSKFGYAAELATGLHKLTKKFKDHYETWAKYDFYKSIILTLAACIILPPVGMIFLGFNLGSIALNLIGTFFGKLFYRDNGMTYDDNRNRIDRLRRFLINKLKSKNIPKGVRESTLASLETVEKAVSCWKDDQDYDMFTKIIMFFSNDRCEIEKNIKIERDLENLASSRLYQASAKLANIYNK